jgi:hypothetical protein
MFGQPAIRNNACGPTSQVDRSRPTGGDRDGFASHRHRRARDHRRAGGDRRRSRPRRPALHRQTRRQPLRVGVDPWVGVLSHGVAGRRHRAPAEAGPFLSSAARTGTCSSRPTGTGGRRPSNSHSAGAARGSAPTGTARAGSTEHALRMPSRRLLKAPLSRNRRRSPLEPIGAASRSHGRRPPRSRDRLFGYSQAL